MKVPFNVLNRQFLMYKSEYEKKAIDVLNSGWYILGKEVQEFEKEFADYIGSKYSVGLASGLDALILAFRALEIKKDDEVIVQANAYIASVLGITENGATPVFTEVDKHYNIDAEKIEEKITDKTKAILVVHLYGQSAEMDKIKNIAQKYNLYLIEDCAQSHGAKFKNKTTGTYGDIGCFSFYPSKNLGCFGDGGAITTDNIEIQEKIKMLRNYGSKEKYKNEIVGVNSRLDEIQAGFLRLKLSHLNELTEERIKICNRYLKEIKNDKLILPEIKEGATSVWHLFVIRIIKREKFQEYLKENGIGTAIHYPIPPYLSDAYKDLKIEKGSFENTEKFADEMLSLPLYNGITNEELDYVIDIINKYQG